MATRTEIAGLAEVVRGALGEDIGSGDVTSQAVVPPDARARASIWQKEPGVIFGLEAAREAFAQMGATGFAPLVLEGNWSDAPRREVARIDGPARSLLAAERVALNILGRLSGIATLTHHYVEAVRDTGVDVLDTRKTTPGLRALEKAAVVAGGGVNHRMGLDDAVLIKENHIAIAGGVATAMERARAGAPAGMPIEIECRTLSEVGEALSAGADRILLDNMDPGRLSAAVAVAKGRARIEASGGVTLHNIRQIAETGVNCISVGALTHSATALDVSMTLEPVG